jgi:hypothetical protein
MTQRFDLQLMTKADAAEVFGVCSKTIENYIKDGLIPKPVPFASKEYWHPADFAAFIDRTFRCMDEAANEPQAASASATAEARPKRNAPLTAGQPQRPRDAKDSHPVVRAKARQQAKLQRLNAGQ